jgi:L-seryl-tRNA(Ser) seleniumtransferase
VAGNQARPTAAQLIQLGKRCGVPTLFDLGWQGTYDVSKWGWTASPSAKALLALGADLILLRGQGLLGGPPCGILMGKAALIERITTHALSRITAASQLTQAALAATLKLYENPAQAEMSIPIVSLLATTEENLKQRAERLAPQIAACRGIQSTEAISAPAWLHVGQPIEQALPSWGIRVVPSSGTLDELASQLRQATPEILGVKTDAGLVLNLRTVLPKDDLRLVTTFENLFPPAPQ